MKKEVRITTKKHIGGKKAKIVGLIFIIPILLSWGFLSVGILQSTPLDSHNAKVLLNIFINIKYVGYLIGFITAIYLVFFHKEKNNELK